MVKDDNLELQFHKQMGCMAGFFQIFDRHHIITGKRHHHRNKRLPHSKVVDDEESSEISGSSTPAEFVKPAGVTATNADSSPEDELQPLKSPHRLSVLELKEEIRSARRLSKETPRLSLDSRAIVDSKGGVHPREIHTNASILTGNRCESSVAVAGGDHKQQQRRSPSVIARLMGIEQLPECNNPESDNAQLRRSASESRVARDLFNNRSYDNNNTHSDLVMHNFKSAAAMSQSKSSNVTAMESISLGHIVEHPKGVNKGLATAQWRSQQHRKSFFDRADVFPEPKQTMSAYAADIEKKLKLRGIDEASKDLESLKQILEALQLKGLLHSSNTPPEHRNFIYDRNFRNEGSPMSVMKQSQSATGRRLGSNSSISKTTVRRNLNERLSNVSVSPRRDRPQPQSDRNGRSPTKTLNSPAHIDSSNGRRSNNSIVKTKTLTVETNRRRSESPDNSRRTSPVQSPRTKSPIDHTVMSKSPRNQRSTAEKHQRKKKTTTMVTEDESSSISESTLSTSSQERSKTEELSDGKQLLDRCDKLLRSISDMTANEMQQPSPVSVLDMYKEDSFSSISPVPKHNIDFQDLSGDIEEELWSSIFQADESSMSEDEHNHDTDYIYISQLLRAYDHLLEDSDIYYILEKHHYLKGNDLSKASVLNRRVIFDIVTEIIESNKKLPPWKAFQWTDPLCSKPLKQKIWAEYRRIRGDRSKAVVEEDIFETVCGVLEKDLAGGGTRGCEDFPGELSEVVLDIERLVFKDLISDTISELAQYAWRSPAAAEASKRKLVF